MALSKTIKGITIEIGGNTTKLQDALKDVNKTLTTTSKSLRDIDKLLKVDPSNVELLKQKQERLSRLRAQERRVSEGGWTICIYS